MYCPLCLKNNINNKIISLTSTCYVCDDDSCNLCLGEEEFNRLSSDNCTSKEVQNTNTELTEVSDNLDNESKYDIIDTDNNTLPNDNLGSYAMNCPNTDATLYDTLCGETVKERGMGSDSSRECVIADQYRLPVDFEPHYVLDRCEIPEREAQLEDISETSEPLIELVISKPKGRKPDRQQKGTQHIRKTIELLSDIHEIETSKPMAKKRNLRPPRNTNIRETGDIDELETPESPSKRNLRPRRSANIRETADINELKTPKTRKTPRKRSRKPSKAPAKSASKVSKTTASSKRKISNDKKCESSMPVARKRDRNSTGEQFASSSSMKNQADKVLNWLKMPVLMKTESKIVSMLLLHLNLLPPDRQSPLLDRAKLEYAICNEFANRFHLDLVKPVCFPLVSQLLAVIQSIPDAAPDTAPVANRVDERVVAILRRQFQQSDSSGDNKCEFFVTVTCKSCQRHSSSIVGDYFLSLPREQTCFKMTRDKIRYSEPCIGCDRNADKQISITKLPQFMIVHAPDGLKYHIDRYDTDLVINQRHFTLVAVIQCGPGSAAVNVPQQRLTHQQYGALTAISRPTSIPTCCWHFRHTNGWCTMSETSSFLCQPSPVLAVDQTANIRFLVYAQRYEQLANPAMVATGNSFSMAQFIDQFQKMHTVDLNRFSLSAAEPQRDVIRQLTVPLEPIDLNSHSVRSHSPSVSSSSDSSSPKKRPASIHSQSTVSRFNGAETDCDVSVDIDRFSATVPETGISRLLHNICFGKPKGTDPGSSSGVSSCSSIVDDRRGISGPSPPASVFSHRSSGSQFSQSASSISSLNILQQKRPQVTIEDLIERKRLKTLL